MTHFFLFKSITINKVTFLNIRSKKNPENFRFFIYSGTSCSSGVGFYGDDEHIINLKEPGCGTVLDNNLKTLPIILVFFYEISYKSYNVISSLYRKQVSASHGIFFFF